MAESLEMMKISPTTEDTIRNRFVEFLIYVLIEFNQYAYQIILVSADKKNTKSKEFTKYLCKAVDAGVTSTITGTSQFPSVIGWREKKTANNRVIFVETQI